MSCKDGYFFKYGVDQESQKFLNAVAGMLNLDSDDMIKVIINKLEADKNDMKIIQKYVSRNKASLYFYRKRSAKSCKPRRTISSIPHPPQFPTKS